MSSTDEEKVAAVRRFSDQMMSAVLDGREIDMFDLIERFFQGRAQTQYKAGYADGFEAGINVAREILDNTQW